MERVRELSGASISLAGRGRVVLEELFPEEHSGGEARTAGEVPGNILSRNTIENQSLILQRTL